MFKVIIFATILAVAAAKPDLISAPPLEIQNTGYLGLPLPLSSRYYQQGYLQSGYLQPTNLQTEYLPSTSYNYNDGSRYAGLGYSGLGLQYQYNNNPYYNYYY